jgi:diguanylate cyclase (GGDEF)-like protein
MLVIQTQTEITKHGFDLGGVMEAVVEQSLVIAPEATGACVELAEGEEMVYRAVAGLASQSLGMRLARATSLSGMCVAQAKALRCDDSESDPHVNREACRKVGLRSMICVPLIHSGQAVGALKVMSSSPNAFTQGDVIALELMAELIAAAMFNATKYGLDELYRRATLDHLTKLANRGLFFDRARQELARATKENKRFAVAMIDIDGLKPINDNYGHRLGDAAIVEMANRLKSLSRETDITSRIGGDEFAILFMSTQDFENTTTAVRRITDHCSQYFEYEGIGLAIGVSVGLALFPEDGQDIDTLVDEADKRMYKSKRERKRSRA